MGNPLLRISGKALCILSDAPAEGLADNPAVKRWVAQDLGSVSALYLDFVSAAECDGFIAGYGENPVPDLATFLAALPRPQHPALVNFMAINVAGLFKLQGDALLAQLLAGHIASLEPARFTPQLIHVAGGNLSVLAFPARIASQGEFTLIAIGNPYRTLSCRIVSRRLDPHQTDHALAVLDGEIERGCTDFLLLSETAQHRLKIEPRLFASTRDLIADHLASDPEMTALLAAASPELAADVNVLAVRQDAPTRITDPVHDLHLSVEMVVANAEGTFIHGFLSDPDHQIEAMILLDQSLIETDLSQKAVRQQKTMKDGTERKAVSSFTAFLPRKPDAEGWATLPSLLVTLKTGARHLVRPRTTISGERKARAAIMSTIASWILDSEALFEMYHAALAGLQKTLTSRGAVSTRLHFGTVSSRQTSIVIPLYREAGFIRSQLIAFSTDPYMREHAEIIFVNDDPADEQRLVQYVKSLSDIYPLDMHFLSLNENCGYALANNLAAAEASGTYLILMNSDVVPVRAHWVADAITRLEQLPPFSILGPKLIYANDTLQHAGMYFEKINLEQWQNMHFWKGYGRHYKQACRAGGVPAVTGACMILKRESFEAVGGFSTDYVIGDYEDSDLCLKLREKGGAAYYLPAIELYHFERQSIVNHKDHSDSGSTSFNRALHTRKWNHRIETLMTEFRERM